MLTSINVKFIFDSACLSASLGDKGLLSFANSRCCLLSCLLAVLAVFLANSSPISSPVKTSEICCHFVFTTKTTQPPS